MAIRQYIGCKYYYAEDIAEILKVSKKTIYKYLREGKIKGSKALHKWWIREESLQAYMNNL